MYRLALELGQPRPALLLEQMTSSEFESWMAYSEVEPFGGAINDLRHGQQMALACNINRDTKSHPAPFTASEFMVAGPEKEKHPPEPETAEQIGQRIKSELFGM